jgi:hypothetical protein
MKIMIAGSRGIKDVQWIHGELDKIFEKMKPNKVIHGGATGVDSIAHDYCVRNRIEVSVFRPNYKKYKNNPSRAPLMRNVEMVKEADIVIAMWDGKSNGTEHVINNADRFGKPLLICRPGMKSQETRNWRNLFMRRKTRL